MAERARNRAPTRPIARDSFQVATAAASSAGPMWTRCCPAQKTRSSAATAGSVSGSGVTRLVDTIDDDHARFAVAAFDPGDGAAVAPPDRWRQHVDAAVGRPHAPAVEVDGAADDLRHVAAVRRGDRSQRLRAALERRRDCFCTGSSRWADVSPARAPLPSRAGHRRRHRQPEGSLCAFSSFHDARGPPGARKFCARGRARPHIGNKPRAAPAIHRPRARDRATGTFAPAGHMGRRMD